MGMRPLKIKRKLEDASLSVFLNNNLAKAGGAGNCDYITTQGVGLPLDRCWFVLSSLFGPHVIHDAHHLRREQLADCPRPPLSSRSHYKLS